MEIGVFQGRPAAAGDERDRHLAPPGIRAPHHRRLRDPRVREQHLFDLGRVDVLPAGLDHVLRPVHEVEGPVLVTNEEVAHVEPAPAEVPGVRLVGAPIAAEEGGGPEPPPRRESRPGRRSRPHRRAGVRRAGSGASRGARETTPGGRQLPEQGGLPVSVEPNVLGYGASRSAVSSAISARGTRSGMTPTARTPTGGEGSASRRKSCAPSCRAW